MDYSKIAVTPDLNVSAENFNFCGENGSGDILAKQVCKYFI